MSDLTLYQIAIEHKQMVEYLMDTQADPDALADTIEAESYPLEVKAQNVVYAARNLEALAAQIKEAEEQMKDRRKALEKRAEHLREYIQTCMEIAGLQKIESPHFQISIAKNPHSVEIFSEDLVPPWFFRHLPAPPPIIEKTAVKEALKAGEDVPGAKLVQSTRLSIK